MKSIPEIIKRAQVLLVMHDRTIWETSYSEGRVHSIKEREKQQKLELNWIKSHSLDSIMSKGDMEFLSAPIETLDRGVCSVRSFEVEAIQPLLWCCGLLDALSPFDQLVVHDFHPQLAGVSFEELSASASLRGKREILKQRELSMLWYWRSRIKSSFDPNNGDSLISAIGEAFGAKTALNARLLGISRADFQVHGIPFSKISEQERIMIERASCWRYHAYEWVLNAESWYNTSTDT